ncbi:hypothetical protein [Leifsonia sp. SIMBA_070]|uniref:hypothetical protein n=1 Tax=Leifsonia sp. SIMBA_070 TaxID=3085810 RepID=UPI00397E1C0F
MKTRTALVVGVCALLAIGAATTAAVVATQHTEAGATPTTSAGTTTGTTTTGTPSRTPASTPSLSPADDRLLDYVRTLPGVNDVTADTVGEFTELTCATLRSPKMSPAFYGQVVAVERKGYGLTADQVDGLLAATARSGCPDAQRVVDSHGAEAATAPVG